MLFNYLMISAMASAIDQIERNSAQMTPGDDSSNKLQGIRTHLQVWNVENYYIHVYKICK
jgi:hypothetical protein